MSVADLWEVGAPCGVVGRAGSEERPGGGERLLGGPVGFLRQRRHVHLLVRPPVRNRHTAALHFHSHTEDHGKLKSVC